MANNNVLRAAKKGSDFFNKWLIEEGLSQIDLSGANLSGISLRWVNFAGANLEGVNFENADLTGCYFGPWSFIPKEPYVSEKNTPVNLSNACFEGAKLLAATFNYPMFKRTQFDKAFLGLANFRNVNFEQSSFESTELINTSFLSCSMNRISGIDSVNHKGPSHIDIETLMKSQGLSQNFIRKTGVPDIFSDYLPDLISSLSPINFFSCFISHASADKEFCDRLYHSMESSGLRVWYAPEHMEGGKKIVNQISNAIHVHDKLIIVLSESSIESTWVSNEIKWSIKREMESGELVLFPISLVSFDKLKDWVLIDPDTGTDLAAEVRSYYIPNFSKWQENRSFNVEYQKLLHALKASHREGG